MALAEVALGRGDVLDHGVGQDEVEALAFEGQAAAVALDEGDAGDRPLGGQACPRVAEAGLEVEADREGRFLGQRKRGAAASAPGVEHPPPQPGARALQGLDDLGAAQVLEHRVVVLAAEAAGGGGSDGRLVDAPHPWSASR